MIVEESKIKYLGVRGIPHLRNVEKDKRHTGTWRVVKPVVDYSKCISCKTCFIICPDSAYKWEEKKPNNNSKLKGRPVVDLTTCKGCGICAQECPAKCIEMKRDLHEEIK